MQVAPHTKACHQLDVVDGLPIEGMLAVTAYGHDTAGRGNCGWVRGDGHGSSLAVSTTHSAS